MKRILNLGYFLFVFLIPIIIIYANVDKYLIVATTSTIEFLQSYLNKLLNNIDSSIEFKTLFIRGVLLVVLIKIINKFIFDRKLGLSLKERKGDWIITTWTVLFNGTIWTVLYNAASFFKINTDAWLESFNVIMVLVMIGLTFKIISTYLYYMENLKKTS